MFTRARELWEGLGRTNQLILVVSTLGILGALVGFVVWASTPEYVPLFSNLSPKDANSIREKLTESNVPSHLTHSGGTIEVPAQFRDEQVMKLMSQGLPEESNAALGESFDALKTPGGPTDTQNMESMKLLRTHESQIAKSIMGLQQIAGATVHIAPSDNSPFNADKHEASASVLVQIKPGQSLTPENVQAIVRVTQMAYTGLSDKSITVVSQHGDLLYDGTEAHGPNAPGARIALQHSLATERRTELQSAIDRVIGVGRAIVLVNVELTGTQEEDNSTITEPGAATSKTTTVEELKGAGKVNGNAPGLGANGGPGNQPLAGAGGPGTPTYASTNSADGNYKQESTQITSIPSQTTRHIVKEPNRIEKLTVSALVDSNANVDVNSIKQVLMTNIGANAGDTTRQVTVSQIAFNHDAEKEQEKVEAAAHSAENTSKMLALAVPLGIMLLTFLLLARALKKPLLQTAGGQLAIAGGGMMQREDGTNYIIGADGKATPAGLVGEMDEDGHMIGVPTGSGGPKTYEVIQEAFDANLESILHLTRSKPETVALLVKSWISQEEKIG